MPDEGVGSGRDKRNGQEALMPGIESFIVTEKTASDRTPRPGPPRNCVGDESRAGGREAAGNAELFRSPPWGMGLGLAGVGTVAPLMPLLRAPPGPGQQQPEPPEQQPEPPELEQQLEPPEQQPEPLEM